MVNAVISSQLSGFDLLPKRPQQLADVFLICGDAAVMTIAAHLKEQSAVQRSSVSVDEVPEFANSAHDSNPTIG